MLSNGKGQETRALQRQRARISCFPIIDSEKYPTKAKGKEIMFPSCKGQAVLALQWQRARNSCSPIAKGRKFVLPNGKGHENRTFQLQTTKFVFHSCEGQEVSALQHERGSKPCSPAAKGRALVLFNSKGDEVHILQEKRCLQ